MKIDSHIHTFNHKETITIPENYDYDYDKKVCFIDIEYDDLKNIDILKSYDNYITSDDFNENDILLATGANINDIKTLLEKYRHIFKGFGELKLYDNYNGRKINNKKISFLKEVCQLSSKNGNLPIYVHWELDSESDVKKIKSVLEKYPNIPIILCHCGFSKNDDLKSYSYIQICQLMRCYDNLWVDISYEALDYFSKNILKLFNLQLNRVIVGTDINNKLLNKENCQDLINTILDKSNIIRSYINSDKNTEELFKLK